MLIIARGTSGADSVEPIAIIRLSLKPALLSPISAENISISKHPLDSRRAAAQRL